MFRFDLSPMSRVAQWLLVERWVTRSGRRKDIAAWSGPRRFNAAGSPDRVRAAPSAGRGRGPRLRRVCTDSADRPPAPQTMPSWRKPATAAASRPSQSASTSSVCSPSNGADLTSLGPPSNRTGKVGIVILTTGAAYARDWHGWSIVRRVVGAAGLVWGMVVEGLFNQQN